MKKIKNALLIRSARVYWYVFRPKTHGAKVLLIRGREILLIRNTYGSGKWNLPGGRIEKGERPVNALVREVKEELDIEVYEPYFMGVVMSSREYKKDTVYCFLCKVTERDFVIDQDEIVEAQWFTLDELPKNSSSIVQEVICLYESAFV